MITLTLMSRTDDCALFYLTNIENSLDSRVCISLIQIYIFIMIFKYRHIWLMTM